MLRTVLILASVLLIPACATTGGQSVPAQRSSPAVADHPDARLAIAIAAELEARAATGTALAGPRPQMEALAAALWSRNEAEPAPEAEVEEIIPPGRSLLYGVHIASYRTQDHAIQGWRTMQDLLPGVLGPLEARVEPADLGERGVYLRLKAGPFTTPEAAQSACRSLSESAIYCQVMAFSGEALVTDVEN